MPQGILKGIAIKPGHHEAMQPVQHADLSPEGGIAGNVAQSAKRRVTFIGEDQWNAANAELATELPWHLRRANLLLSGLFMPDLLGKTLQIGDVQFTVNGETEPCSRMDEIQPGLQQALRPQCRGGVYASVTQGGTIHLGDTVSVLP